MDDLNWKEFQQLVPAKIKTVILTVGTLETHGFINNGADNTVPVAIANAIAGDVNVLIAPHIPYGVTDILAPYPGSLHIPEDAFRIYVRAVLVGLVDNGFRNIVILNGHGPHVPILQQLANEISLQYTVNTLLVNWWILSSGITRQVFGEDGGPATNDETAMVQAANPKLCVGIFLRVRTWPPPCHRQPTTGRQRRIARESEGFSVATDGVYSRRHRRRRYA